MTATEQARAAFEARLEAGKLFGTTDTAQRGITPAQRAQDATRNTLRTADARHNARRFSGEQVTGWGAL